MKKIIISTLVSTLILFLWGGLTQLFPWGVATTQSVTAKSEANNINQLPNLKEFPPNSLTNEKFDELFANKVSTYSTDKTFSWIVTQPLKDGYSAYFIKELITQLLVSILLALLLSLTVQLDFRKRVIIIIIVSLAGVSAIYGQLMNWWGLPAGYALGAGFNLIIGWTIASLVSARFFIKSSGNLTNVTK